MTVTYPLIRKPYFATAGQKFGWLDEYGMAGIGLNKSFLSGKPNDSEEVVEVPTPKGTYFSTVKKLADFFRSHANSYMKMRGKTILVFPHALFDFVDKPQPSRGEEVHRQAAVARPQLALF